MCNNYHDSNSKVWHNLLHQGQHALDDNDISNFDDNDNNIQWQ